LTALSEINKIHHYSFMRKYSFLKTDLLVILWNISWWRLYLSLVFYFFFLQIPTRRRHFHLGQHYPFLNFRNRLPLLYYRIYFEVTLKISNRNSLSSISKSMRRLIFPVLCRVECFMREVTAFWYAHSLFALNLFFNIDK
jgi:hypothetical protein